MHRSPCIDHDINYRKSRKQKAEKTKNLGSPIEIPGKALGIEIRGSDAWIAENTAVARVVDLEVGYPH